MRVCLACVLGCALARPVVICASDLLPPDKPVAEVVDSYIDARLREENVAPAPQADDATLARRLYLDLVGRIPTVGETRTFVESKDADKRARLVDRLMASPGFVRHQATALETLLAYQGRRGSTGTGLHGYLLRALAENRSWDRIFRELILPNESDPAQKGASEFLRARTADPDRLTNDVSVLFFGVNVSCAQCHDHPLVSDWKQDNFYGMKAFFNRTFDNAGFLAERSFGPVRFKPNKGAEKQARMMFLTGTVVDDPGARDPNKAEADGEKAAFEAAKKGKTAPPAPKWSARAKLVDLALRPGESDFFARSAVNRTWHRFFGFGLVTPLDQMHSENPPSHPELLRWLARDLAGHGYDTRRLVRGLVMSQAYSRASIWPGPADKAPSPRLFAVGQVKPLTPMQFATSLRIATADPLSFEKLSPAEFEKRIEGFEQAAHGFASLIAQPTDDFQIGVAEALLFSNSDRVTKDLLADGNDRLLGRVRQADTEKAVNLLFAAALSRQPTPEELKELTDYLKRRPDRPAEAYRQVLWALLAGAEFRFNY